MCACLRMHVRMRALCARTCSHMPVSVYACMCVLMRSRKVTHTQVFMYKFVRVYVVRLSLRLFSVARINPLPACQACNKIREMVGTKSIHHHSQQQMIKWFGHLTRLPIQHPTQHAYNTRFSSLFRTPHKTANPTPSSTCI